VKGDRIVGVRGIGTDRVNHGRLGPKGLHAWVANHSRDRLTRPLIREGGKPSGRFRQASWAEAMSVVADRCGDVRDTYTSGAIGFYNTGQLFIEDYYTLSTIAHAGLGTNHIDGNTRLCTATAAMALRESFGQDGQPACIADFDECDCLVHCGHNIAATQTVSWMRILDRRQGPARPTLIAIDPRRTPTAQEADIHLAPRVGTNVALMNGLINLVIQAGHVDQTFIERRAIGFPKLREVVSEYPSERVEQITGVPADKLREAAAAIGSAKRLLCTVLQGFYQSNQATAAAVQVNNLVLIRGMIGKPGCGVIQSNGQPTAQNTRETGCDGEHPGFRNWENPSHLEQIARIWNVEPKTIPQCGPHTHAMQIFRLAELGAIKFLWIICTNPAVSLPELHRIRRILQQEKLFVVVNDAFMTETAALADVVLPAAMWGEKTGTFTNYDRTVHISQKAVAPPGEARTDMEIFLDFAERLDLRDNDGKPLVKWRTPEGAFEAWKHCSKGTPCDYSGLSYRKLLESPSGIQWPCNERYPDGKARLYEDHVFPTHPDQCIGFGHDIETGAHRSREEYLANDPRGRAVLKAAHYQPPFEAPDDTYPFWALTGRLVYHFHTRTKTGRSRELRDAAPEAFVQMHEADARRLGIAEGDMVEVASRRGTITAPAQIGDIIPGHVFLPFHYGYWDEAGALPAGGPNGRARAANELTLTGWDPVSKQPTFKYAAVQVAKAGQRSVGERFSDAGGKLVDRAAELADKVSASMHVERSHVSDYLGILKAANQEFVSACQYMIRQHEGNAEIREGALRVKQFGDDAVQRIQPFLDKYGEKAPKEPHKLRQTLFSEDRGAGGFGLLCDIHALFVLVSENQLANHIVLEAAKELRDDDLLQFCSWLGETIRRQQAWCVTMATATAPQSLVVPS
jgi:anaerobic selenocysteine-containing dehydrogenase